MDHRSDPVMRGRPLASGRDRGSRSPSAACIKSVLWSLAALEILWISWFLVVPLQNVTNLGRPIQRGLLVLTAIPEVVPDNTFRQSLLGNGLIELSHVENLPQRIPIVLVAGLIAAAAIGLGDLVIGRFGLRDRLGPGERIALGYGLGTAFLGVGTLIVGRMGWLDPRFIRTALGMIATLGFISAWMHRRRGTARVPEPVTGEAATGDASPNVPPRDPLAWLFLLVIVPFVILMILGAMLPTIDFDVLEYHLEGPKEYYQAGRISFLPHNVYTNMPFGVEMLHLLGMVVMADWWWGALAGQVLVALFAPAAAVLVAATASRASTRAGWLAALVFLSTPWIYRLGVIAYVEGPLCFYHASLVWGFIRLCRDPSIPSWRSWGLLGILAGGAMACKYTGLISAVIPFGMLALAASIGSRRFAPLLAYILGWSLVMSPWLIKNVNDTGDPVYPLGYRVFHGRYWDKAMEVKWQNIHGPHKPITLREFGNSLVEIAGGSDWQSPLYIALAPLALLRTRSFRMAIALWGYAAYIFLTWWFLTHRLDRFWLPILPVLAVLAGLGGDWIRHRGWSILLGFILSLGLFTNLTYVTTALAGLNEWTADLRFLRRDLPERWNRPLATMDAGLPSDARILLVGQAAVFHLSHDVVYNTVFNKETIETLASGTDAAGLHRALRDLHLTHVYVDWKEIARHRQPGGYGFTDFVTPERFAAWVKAGVLDRPRWIGTDQELYAIR
jgi:hypothetical protein